MKKLVSFLLATIMAISSLCFSTVTSFAVTAGDVNHDGKINATDALMILSYSADGISLTKNQKKSADINNDGEINSLDALFILEVCVGIRIFENGININLADYPTLDKKWMKTVVDNYKEFSSEIGRSRRIPLIVSTDQHGSIKADSEVFKFINDLVDWNKISKIINLGDTVELTYSKSQLKAYNEAMRYIPMEKRLELEGNHDAHISAVKRDVSKYFPAPSAEMSKNKTAFTVTDESFNVRYLAINPMDYPWSYTTGKIDTTQADFIVSELEKTDASDIIILSHPYLFRDAIIRRDGTTFTGSDTFVGTGKKGADVKQSLLDMFLARKNRTAGVFVDSKGVEHPYDFTNCKGDLLMSLHGHHHTEGYETSNGFTEFMFQSFRHNGSIDDSEPNCFYFAYIDGNEKTFKCWKNIEGYSAWKINIA